MRNHKRPQLSPLFDLEHSLFRKTRPQPPESKPTQPAQESPSEAPLTHRVKAQAFDWDEAIELEYRQEVFPVALSYPSQFSEKHALSADLEYSSQSFEVEAFELDETESKAEAFELEDEDIADSDNNQFIQAEKSEVKTPKQSKPRETSPTKEVEVEVSTPFSVQSLRSAQPIETLDSAEDAARGNPSTDTFDAEAFAADMEAILLGTTNDYSQPADAPPAQSHPHDVFDQIVQGKLPPPTSSPEPPAPEARSSTYSHAIFDQMAQGMTYANSFNLGTISLEQQFDEIDRLIDQQEQQNQIQPEPVLSHALELDETELAEDLALINGVEFAGQMGQLPTKGKLGKGSGGEKRKQPQKNPPSERPATLPHQSDNPIALFHLIWNNQQAKVLLCEYARSYPALVGDLDLLMAIETKEHDQARCLLTNPPQLESTINCIAFDGMVPQDITDEYLDESTETIIGKFVEDHFRSGKFYSSDKAQQITDILARSQQMTVPAIDTMMDSKMDSKT